MGAEHDWFEELAVGHVLGGLEAADAAAFRSHLAGCTDCRSRVAELRGIAADLAAAERDERTREVLRTELSGEEGEDELVGEPPPRIGVRQVTGAVIVVAMLAGAMAFWNLHLRTAVATITAVAERQTETLELLAEGVELEVEVADDLAARAASDGDRAAVAVSGLPELAPDEALVGWLVGGEVGPAQPVLLVRPVQLVDGVVAVTVELEGARVLVVTRERGQPGEQPGPEVLVTVPLGNG